MLTKPKLQSSCFGKLRSTLSLLSISISLVTLWALFFFYDFVKPQYPNLQLLIAICALSTHIAIYVYYIFVIYFVFLFFYNYHILRLFSKSIVNFA